MAKKKVLIIDDNPVVTHFSQSLFDSKGFDSVIAVDGTSGVEKAISEMPDLILLDIILPGKHGFEVCKEIKRNEATKNIPIIIVTSSGLEEVALNEPDVNAEGYLAKPFKWEDVEKVLRKVWPETD